ncbi:hypothetical protein PVAP13_1NG418519 [Panicum virgatum]|uniref:Uncharacterized protein n=1 Tax=Panicum virgatum TaxID=38727 RepID=A0A8T0X5D1_PANVG|nr:hypothetical protein PVAP13_1NG418519 [Panicum virgatum]
MRRSESYNGGAAVDMTWGNEPTPSPHEATPVRVPIFSTRADPRGDPTRTGRGWGSNCPTGTTGRGPEFLPGSSGDEFPLAGVCGDPKSISSH